MTTGSRIHAPTEERVSARLKSAMLIGWIGVMLTVSVCILIGMRWSFQPGEGGPPTQVLAIRHGTLTPEQVDSDAGTIPAALSPGHDTTFGYGIQALFDIDTDSTLDQVQTLGMGWIKQEVSWAQVEPEAGNYRWNGLDKLMVGASARNLKVILTVNSAPEWARSVTARDKSGPPDSPQAYSGFIAQLIQRYPNAIQGIEIWDEQNIAQNWYGAGGLDPVAYLELLITASQTIRQLDPDILIISGGLTPTGLNDGVTAIDDFNYMEQLISGGMLDYVDCVGAHHIGFNLPPGISAEDAFSGGMPDGTIFVGPYDTSNPSNPHHSWSFYSTLNGYHNMIVAAKHETSLCVTEFGWASAVEFGRPAPGFEFALDNSLEKQALYILRAYQNMYNWRFIRLAVLYNLDYASKKVEGLPESASLFSILRPNGLPRPAFQAVRDMPKLP